MIISYFPKTKIIIDNVEIAFGESRKEVRQKLAQQHDSADQKVLLGGSAVYQRRDIYKNLNNSENLFFLDFDENELLQEFELHYCDKIKFIDVEFDFSETIDQIASKVSKYSNIKQLEGEYLFMDINAVIMNKDQMGGEGLTLGYLYCAIDISHLL